LEPGLRAGYEDDDDDDDEDDDDDDDDGDPHSYYTGEADVEMLRGRIDLLHTLEKNVAWGGSLERKNVSKPLVL
jgi:hypothetical protein